MARRNIQGLPDLIEAVQDILEGGSSIAPSSGSGSDVQSAITNLNLTGAGGEIVLGTGDHIWDRVPVVPPNMTAKITVRGAPGARIVLQAGKDRAFDAGKLADHDVCRNFELRDLVIDNNNIVGTARHIIFGNKPSAVSTSRLNFDSVTIKNIVALNLVTDITSTATQWGVLITPTQAAAGEATQTYARNITVEDVQVFNGNACVNVIGSVLGAGVAGYNLFMDNINISRCRHYQSAIVGRGALNGLLIWGASFHIGSRGYGGKATVRDCYSYGIGDVAFEMNSLRDILVENCVAEEAAGYAFYHTNYNYPDTDTIGPPTTVVPGQRMVWRNCRFIKRTSESYGAPFSVSMNLAIPIGTVDCDNCSAYIKKPATITDWQVPNGDFFQITAPWDTVTITKFKGVIEGVNYNQAGADSATLIYALAQLGGSGINRFVVRDIDITMTGDAPGAGLLGINGFSLLGVGLKFEIDGVTYNQAVTNNAGAGGNIVSIGGVATYTAEGFIRRLKVIANTDGRGITVRGTTLLTIPTEIVVEDCDFTGMTAGLNDLQFFADGTSNADKVRPVRNKWRTYHQSRQPVAASFTADLGPDLIAVTSTAAARVVTLPAAADYPVGRVLTVKDESGGAATNNITVARAGADTIDGAVSVIINTNFGVTRIYSDGANWHVA